jgi:hypothetical protein
MDLLLEIGQDLPAASHFPIRQLGSLGEGGRAGRDDCFRLNTANSHLGPEQPNR